jgi:Flp pilus assembly protein TadG
MLMTKIHCAPIALRQRFQRIAQANEGVAAVEFALILPIMLFMFLGVLEISHAVTVDRRVSQVASTTGDLVARAESILDSEIVDIMKVGGYLMAPYPSAKLKMTIRSVVSLGVAESETKEKWRCTSNDVANNAFSCECVNYNVTPSNSGNYFLLPAGLVAKTDKADGVLIAEVEYGYKPVLYDTFFKNTWGNPVGGLYTFRDKIYQKPRLTSTKLKIGSSPLCG